MAFSVLTKLRLQGNLIDFLNILRPMLEFDIIGGVLKWQKFLKFNDHMLNEFEESFPS